MVLAELGCVRGPQQPRSRRRPGREARQSGDRQRPVRVRPVPRRLRGRRRGRERPALDRPGAAAISVLAVFPTRHASSRSRARRRNGSAHPTAAASIRGPVGAEQRDRRPRRRALRGRADRLARSRRGTRTRLACRAGQGEHASSRPGFTNISDLAFDWARTCSCWRWPPTGLLRAALAGRADSSSRRAARRTVLAQRRARLPDGARDRQRLDLHLEPRPVPGLRRRAARRAGPAPAAPLLIRGRRLRCDDAAAHRRRHDSGAFVTLELTVGRDRRRRE